MQIRDCKLCDNCIKRNNILNGYGNEDSDIIFLFDHPRYRQDKTAIFRADVNVNKLLGLLSNYGFNEFNSYFTFLVKCRPASLEAFAYSRDVCSKEHLSKEFKGKKLLVTVGPAVSNYVLGDRFGYFRTYQLGSIVIALPHPKVFDNIATVKKLQILKDTYNIIR